MNNNDILGTANWKYSQTDRFRYFLANIYMGILSTLNVDEIFFRMAIPNVQRCPCWNWWGLSATENFSGWTPLPVGCSLQLQRRKFPSRWRWKHIKVWNWKWEWIWQGVVKGMSAAMKSMNLEKISTLMDNFEKEFEVMLWDGYSDNEVMLKGHQKYPPPSHLGFSWTCIDFVAHLREHLL